MPATQARSASLKMSTRNILITGCTPGGIGHALAKQFYSRNFRVFATARSLDKITDLHELGIVCVELVVDDPTSVAAAHKKIETLLAGQGLDILINNAGKSITRPAVESSPAEVQDIFNSNLFGPVNMIRSFLPHLLRAKGMIVNIG